GAFFTLLAILVTAYGAFLGVYWTVKKLKPKIGVVVKDSGAIVITSEKQTETAVFLLSSTGSDDGPWIDSGIRLEAGKVVTTRASGRICLAYQQLITTAYTHKPPPQPWIGPDGFPSSGVVPIRSPRAQDWIRLGTLLATNFPQGMLLAVVVDKDPNK